MTVAICLFLLRGLQCVRILSKYGSERLDASLFYSMSLGKSQVINTLTSHGSYHSYEVYIMFPSLLIKSHQIIPVSQGLCELVIQSASGYAK